MVNNLAMNWLHCLIVYNGSTYCISGIFSYRKIMIFFISPICSAFKLRWTFSIFWVSCSFTEPSLTTVLEFKVSNKNLTASKICLYNANCV